MNGFYRNVPLKFKLNVPRNEWILKIVSSGENCFEILEGVTFEILEATQKIWVNSN